MTSARIDYDAPAEIRSLLSEITRTEDVKLSPDNSRLAVVDYIFDKIYLFSIRIQHDDGAASPAVAILDYSVFTSNSLHQPHGLIFLDNHNIAVCNRTGDVCLYEIPAPGAQPRERRIKPKKSIRGTGLLRAKVQTPGSLDGYALDDGRYRVLVCNNHWHFISSHIIEPGSTARINNTGTLIQNRLKVPDGICISPDRAWIAVSNHVTGEILIYANTPQLNSATEPVAALQGIVCPHGVRFAPDGKLFVADAASPYLHVFETGNGCWAGDHAPAMSIRVMDDEIFYDGRYDAREGGLKGIDIDNSGRVLVTTHRFGVLEFHDLRGLLAGPATADEKQMLALCDQRDQSLKHQKRGALDRQWNFSSRWRQMQINLDTSLQQKKKDYRTRKRLLRLWLHNRRSRTSVLDPCGPVLSMTSHPQRIELAFYALESIALGTRKPRRMILWLTDEAACHNPPATLQRLRSRGLEIRWSEEFGPHTKYYPYIEGESELSLPLVTADDDTLYPPMWLQHLIEAYEAEPSAIHCFRAHRMGMSAGRLTPYNTWGPCPDRKPSHFNFITGVSGVIYPPGFQSLLKQQGKAFTRCCPSGDDIWLSMNALRGGFKVAQIHDDPLIFHLTPGSQKRRLYDINVVSGMNQLQLRRTYSEADLLTLHNLAAASETV